MLRTTLLWKLFFGWILTLPPIVVISQRGQIDFIRNGTDAPPGKYPFFVGLHVRTYGLICGGTLVDSSGVVLTAAHCRNFGYGSLPLFMFSVEVNGKFYPVHSAKMHPSYDPKQRENGSDVMLLYFTNHDRNDYDKLVVTLNSDPTIPLVNTVVSLAGYGLTDTNWNSRPSCLQEATDLIIQNCQDADESWFHDKPLLCTRVGPSNASVCNFDSGSPLLYFPSNNNNNNNTNHNNNHNDEAIQIGILSLADNGGENGHPPCSYVTSGFTPVAMFHDWIQENIISSRKNLRKETAGIASAE